MKELENDFIFTCGKLFGYLNLQEVNKSLKSKGFSPKKIEDVKTFLTKVGYGPQITGE